jgi:hypothetical protein
MKIYILQSKLNRDLFSLSLSHTHTDHRSRITTKANDNNNQTSAYTFSSPSLIPVATQIDLSSCSLPRIPSNVLLQPDPQDEFIQQQQQQPMVTDQIPEPTRSSEQPISHSHNTHNPIADHPPQGQTTRSRAGTNESQRPSTTTGFLPTGDEDMNFKVEETTHMDSSTEPSLQQHHPLPSSSTLPPLSNEPSTLVSSTTSTRSLPSATDEHIIPPPNPPRVPSPPVNRQMGAASAGVSHELAAQFEPIFTNWLGRLCSDRQFSPLYSSTNQNKTKMNDMLDFNHVLTKKCSGYERFKR